MDFGTNNILITGANGWLGRTLIKSLVFGLDKSKDFGRPQKNLKIKCLILPGENADFIASQSQSNNIKIFYGDITNPKDCEIFMKNSKGAILFHCAGIIHPKKVKHFYDINVYGTENILISAVKNRVKKAIIVSSNSPCGVNPNKEHVFDEKCEYNPYLNYGKSKMIMEKLVKDYVKKGLIEAVIIRPPWFYGPYQPKRQTQFYKMIINGKLPIVGSGDNNRSMACTINICQGIFRAAINNNANGNIYWISDEHPYTFNYIISTIKKVFKNEFGILCKNRSINVPGFISDIAYVTDNLIQKAGWYNKEIHVLSEMNKTIACSIDKAKTELGYKPEISLYEGTFISIKSIISELR